jgi:hypothetical protein
MSYRRLRGKSILRGDLQCWHLKRRLERSMWSIFKLIALQRPARRRRSVVVVWIHGRRVIVVSCGRMIVVLTDRRMILVVCLSISLDV